jgi:TonB family protein
MIHLILAIAMMANWYRPQGVVATPNLTVITLARTPDSPLRRKKSGIEPERRTTKASTTAITPPIVKLPPLSQAPLAEPLAEASVPVDGGEQERLAQVSETYRSALTAHIEEARLYPRRALLRGYQGAGAIFFRLDREGRLIEASVETSTGRKGLDRAALALVQRAAPFPAIPVELPDELAITMPIRFLIVDAPSRMATR